MSVKSARFWAVISCLAFVGGMYFPLAALMEPGPSVMAYGVMMVSLPAWTLGVLSGGLAGCLASRAEEATTRLRSFSWVCCAMSLVAIVISWLWNPVGVS